MDDQRLGIWLVDPSGFSAPLFLATGHPNPAQKRLEFVISARTGLNVSGLSKYLLHITAISKPPHAYDKSNVIAQAEWSGVIFVKGSDSDSDSDDFLPVWAITDMFLPHESSEAAYGPDVLAIPWSLQP